MEAKNRSQHLTKKQNIMQILKFTLFSASAALIQLGVSSLFQFVFLASIDPNEKIYYIVELTKRVFISDTIGLACSIVWSFTFNRKFTFKAASNIPKAMALAFLFYLPFYHFQIWYMDRIYLALFGSLGDDGAYMVALVSCMLINFVLEFLWQRFVVFRNKINTNDVAKRDEEKAKMKVEKAAEDSTENQK